MLQESMLAIAASSTIKASIFTRQTLLQVERIPANDINPNENHDKKGEFVRRAINKNQLREIVSAYKILP